MTPPGRERAVAGHATDAPAGGRDVGGEREDTGRSDPRRHLPSRVSPLGPRQVCLRARLRDTASDDGNGLSKARRIPIEVPEQGGQSAGKRAAGLRGRHSNQPSSVLESATNTDRATRE